MRITLNQQQTQPTLTLQTETTRKPPEYMYLLLNTAYFFLDFVVILIEETGFRLIAYDRAGDYLFDKTYPTDTGAKIAFLKRFGDKYYNEKPIAIWTIPYAPEKEWMEEKIRFIDSLPAHCRQKKIRGNKMIFLATPGLYNLDYVFIIDIETGYRLVVHDFHNNYLVDKKYKTIGGAKMAFRILFGSRYALTGQKPEPSWTPYGQTEKEWTAVLNRMVSENPGAFIDKMKINVHLDIAENEPSA